MAMTRVTALTYLRNLLRSKSGGNWTDAVLNVYLGTPALDYAYELTIKADKTRYATTATLTGTGNELLDLPADYRHIIELTNDTSSDYYVPYTEFSLFDRPRWRDVVPNGYGYYFQGTKIGVLPKLATGETLTLKYYATYTAWTDTTESDLPELAEWVAIYKAAVIALTDRGDANLGAMIHLLQDAAEQLHNLRRGSRAPQQFVAREGGPGFAIISVG